MKFSLQQFGGIAPRIRPRYLPESQAQTADNVDPRNMSILPITGVGTGIVTLPKTGPIKTLYRFGQDVSAANRPSQYWFHWAEDVDVCRGQISGDVSEWTYFTGETFSPRMTNSTLALTGGGTSYPISSLPLGLPAPSSALTAVSDGTPAGDGTDQYAVYIYTNVYSPSSSYTVEGPPSQASGQVLITDSTTVTLNGFAAVPGGDYIVTHRRIYRSISGTYFFVKEITAATTETTDTAGPDELAEEIPSLYNFEPPATLRGLTNLANGIMAGFVGRDVYFCEPYKPYAWPTQYMQSLDYPIVGLGAIDTTLVVLTTGTPYFIQGSHPESMVVVETEIEQACASKRSIVSMNGMVIYASPDGIVALSPSSSKILTLGLIDRSTWKGWNPSLMQAFGHDNKYFVFKEAGGTAGGMFDFDTGQFTLFNPVSATAGFTDIQDDVLYLVNSNKEVTAWGGGSTPMTAKWKSKKFTVPHPLSFALAQVLAEAYNSVTFKLYVDGTLAHTQTVTSEYQFRLPPTVGTTFEVEIVTTDEVYAVNIAQSAEELSEI